MKDEISKLCDDTLIKILGFLSFNEAARTSVISRRWQHLWKYSGCLNLEQIESKHECVKGFNKSLNSHQASTIYEFRVHLDLDENSKSYVDEWIGIALQKKVKRLELNFAPQLECWDYMLSHKDKVYACYCLTKETLSFGLSGIQFLTCLSLKYVGLSDESLESIVSSCPLLESFDVSYSPHLIQPKVSALRLKQLKLFFCYYSIQSIEIYAPNLVSFEYFGRDIALDIKCAPKLNRVCYCDSSDYGYPNLSSHLAKYLPQLVTLSLGASVLGALHFPELTSLKHLRCEAFATRPSALQSLTSLIEKAPILQKIELEFGPVRKNTIRKMKEIKLREMWTRVTDYPNKYIKEVEIVGFPADEAQAIILTYLLKNAVMLETIRIDTSRVCIGIRNYTALEGGRRYTYREMTKYMASFMIDKLIQNRPKPQLTLS